MIIIIFLSNLMMIIVIISMMISNITIPIIIWMILTWIWWIWIRRCLCRVSSCGEFVTTCFYSWWPNIIYLISIKALLVKLTKWRFGENLSFERFYKITSITLSANYQYLLFTVSKSVITSILIQMQTIIHKVMVIYWFFHLLLHYDVIMIVISF